jgi:hypothetical protein
LILFEVIKKAIGYVTAVASKRKPESLPAFNTTGSRLRRIQLTRPKKATNSRAQLSSLDNLSSPSGQEGNVYRCSFALTKALRHECCASQSSREKSQRKGAKSQRRKESKKRSKKPRLLTGLAFGRIAAVQHPFAVFFQLTSLRHGVFAFEILTPSLATPDFSSGFQRTVTARRTLRVA